MQEGVKKRRIVSICGGSGSGKSFLVKKFTNYTRISTDDFYLGKSKMQPNEYGAYNFDNPKTVNLEQCAEAVVKLAQSPAGTKVTIPHYDMKISEPIGTRTLVTPDANAIIIVEGIFSFYSPLLELADFKIFMDPPPEVALARRYKRDLDERGRTPISILKQYPSVIKGYEEFVEPVKKYADIIVDFGHLI